MLAAVLLPPASVAAILLLPRSLVLLVDSSAPAVTRLAGVVIVSLWIALMIVGAGLASRSRSDRMRADIAMSPKGSSPLPTLRFFAEVWVDVLQLWRSSTFRIAVALSLAAMLTAGLVGYFMLGLPTLFTLSIVASANFGLIQLVGKNAVHAWIGEVTIAKRNYWRYPTLVASFSAGFIACLMIGFVGIAVRAISPESLASALAPSGLVWIAVMAGSALIPYSPHGGGTSGLVSITCILFAAVLLIIFGWMQSNFAHLSGLAYFGLVFGSGLVYCALTSRSWLQR